MEVFILVYLCLWQGRNKKEKCVCGSVDIGLLVFVAGAQQEREMYMWKC